VLLLMGAPSGVQERTILERFSDEASCLVVRERVDRAMRESYPTDQDFQVRCEYKEVPTLEPSMPPKQYFLYRSDGFVTEM